MTIACYHALTWQWRKAETYRSKNDKMKKYRNIRIAHDSVVDNADTVLRHC
jgi:hypothetical protein